MSGKWSTAAPGAQHPVRHGLAFLFSGSLAFAVDAGVLKLVIAAFGLHPILARVVSLACAHVAGWLSHRRFTFRLATSPTLNEFVRYAGVQSTVAVINYAIYVAVLLLRPATEPLLALFIASGLAMFLSYFGIRFGAFRQAAVRPSGSDSTAPARSSPGVGPTGSDTIHRR
jgi:putative flippase GtrA